MYLKMTQSERILFDKLQLEVDDELVDFQRKPRRYRHREHPRQVPVPDNFPIH